MNNPNNKRDVGMIAEFGRLTSPEAAQQKQSLLILPVGALEQHGDGLPLFTDTLRADYVAQAVAHRMESRAFVLPTLPYGVSPHHASFAGTISLSGKLFIELVSSIIRSLADAGWERLLVVSGHGGNVASLGVIEQDLLLTHPDFHFAWTPVTALAKESLGRYETSEISGHSGEAETAQVLAIDSTVVDEESLVPGACSREQLSPKALLSRTQRPSSAVRFEEYADNGVLGDPRTSTVEQGQEILEEIITRLTEYADAMARL